MAAAVSDVSKRALAVVIMATVLNTDVLDIFVVTDQ